MSMLPAHVSAGIEHYYVSVSNDTDGFSGYAAIEKQNDGKVTGRLCAFDDTFQIGDTPSLETLGTAKIEGTSSRKYLELQFHPEDGANSRLKAMMPDGKVKLEPRKDYKFSLEGILKNGDGWQIYPADEKAPQISLARIRSEIKLETRDRFAGLENEKKFDLRRFDKLSPERALSLVAKTKWNEVVAPGVVQAVYRPSDRSKIVEFLSKYDGVQFFGTSQPDCGAPYIEEGITVPGLLEFYFARKLQISGLVARAYPYELPRSPPVLELSLKSLELKSRFKPEALSVAQRSQSVGDFVETELKSFLKERRPNFQSPWEVRRRNSGSAFVYRWEVVGASVSACNPARWERFDIQIAFTLGDMVTLQVLDGAQAPSALTDRPSDERFKDNKLDDDALGKIQESFHGFLVKRGLTVSDASDPAFTEACKL
jgi:hypothetical protein